MTFNNDSEFLGYEVEDPERFGVVEFDSTGRVISIEEKPQYPKSNIAQTGLFFYTNDVVGYAKNLKPSARGELEITDINKIFLEKGNLSVVCIDEEVKWLDAGTKDSLIDSSIIVRDLENETGRKYGCIDEVAYKNKWISKEQLLARANELYPSDYSKDLLRIAKGIGVKVNKR